MNNCIDIRLAKTKHKKTSWGITVDKNSITWRSISSDSVYKTLGLSALAGLASEGVSEIMKRNFGNRIQNGGFIIPQNKIDRLIAYKYLSTNKRKQNIMSGLQTGGNW